MVVTDTCIKSWLAASTGYKTELRYSTDIGHNGPRSRRTFNKRFTIQLLYFTSISFNSFFFCREFFTRENC